MNKMRAVLRFLLNIKCCFGVICLFNLCVTLANNLLAVVIKRYIE